MPSARPIDHRCAAMSLPLTNSIWPLAIGLAAVGLGVSIDVYVKHLAQYNPLLFVIALRFLFGGVLAILVFLTPVRQDGVLQRRTLPSRQGTIFHSGRAVLQLVTSFLFFYGLTQIPLAIATLLGFSAALMLPFIAWPMLGERPTALALAATALGFCGTAVATIGGAQTVNPNGNYLLGVVCCVVAAFVYAIILVLLRMRAGQEDAVTMSVFTSTVPGILLLPIVVVNDGQAVLQEMVSTGAIWHILLLSLIAYSVWFMMSVAYARAPAQQLAPLEYTALIWSALAGYFLFDESHSWHLWAGAVLVIAACLIVAGDRHFSTRRGR
ncbi:MAG: DMT family transporter [Pseudomonadota bacterium]